MALCALWSDDELTFELESGGVPLRLGAVKLVHQPADHAHHPGLGQVVQPARVLQHRRHRDVKLREGRMRSVRCVRSLPGPGLRGGHHGAAARVRLPSLAASPPLV